MRAFLLAGGRSRRMGQDKARLELAGRPLVVHMLSKLGRLGLEAAICGNRPDLAALAPVLPDSKLPDWSLPIPRPPGESSAGPLAGILAALEAPGTPLNLFLAVDMPGIPLTFLRWIIDRAERTRSPATIPFVSGRAQPLCAVYHRDLAAGIRQSMEAGERRVLAALRSAAPRADIFDLESLIAIDAIHPLPAGLPHHWLRNLNTPREFALYASQHPSNKL